MFQHLRVKPTAASRTSGCGSEFSAFLTKDFSGFAQKFGRERTLSHSRSICFCNTDHVFEMMKRNPGSDQGSSRSRVGTGDIRIRPEVHVQTCSLSAFQ